MDTRVVERESTRPLSQVEFLKQKAGDTFLPPANFLPESTLPGVECRKDDKTGLPVYEKEARISVVRELGGVITNGGEVVLLVWDDDDLKGGNDNYGKEFGDGIITWGVSLPLHELNKLGLSCRMIAMRPTGSPDDTYVFFENPSAEDKQKLEELNRRLNDSASAIELPVNDKKGNLRPYNFSVSAGLVFSPKDDIEVMRRRRSVNYDGTANLGAFTEGDLGADLADLKQNREEFQYTIVEGLIQVATDHGVEAKGYKQLAHAEAFLEALMGKTRQEFNLAVRKRFAGSRTSDVVWEAIDKARDERYAEPE